MSKFHFTGGQTRRRIEKAGNGIRGKNEIVELELSEETKNEVAFIRLISSSVGIYLTDGTYEASTAKEGCLHGTIFDLKIIRI